MFKKVLISLVLILTLSGCYRNISVQENQVILEMKDGNTISNVGGAGRYTDNGWYASYQIIDASTKQVEWTDPSLATSDQQIVGISITADVVRPRDAETVKNSWRFYNSEMQSDETLANLVRARLAQAAKDVSSGLTLDQMLGTGARVESDEASGRSMFNQKILEKLNEALANTGFTVTNLSVTNVEPSASYQDVLDQRARSKAESELIRNQTANLEKQLEQEIINTKIALEEANRAQQVKEIESQVYVLSPELLELEKMKIMYGALKSTDKVYFISPDTNITLLMGASPVITTTR